MPPSMWMDTLCVCRLALGAAGPTCITSIAGASVDWAAAAAGDGISATAEFVQGWQMPPCVYWLVSGTACPAGITAVEGDAVGWGAAGDGAIAAASLHVEDANEVS